MQSHPRTLQEQFARNALSQIPAGSYFVDYTDSTHLGNDKWIQLVEITLDASDAWLFEEDKIVNAFYTVRPALHRDGTALSDGDARVLKDQLCQSLLRLGMIRPGYAANRLQDLLELSRNRAAILVPDTNALANGTLHWLVRSLTRTSLWLLPAVVSLVTVQQRDTRLKAMVNKSESKNLQQALRSRSLVNASLGLLERAREGYQILELDPQLLRYVRPAGKGTVDPDEGDILEDRLLVEAIHTVFRAARSRTPKRVVTSDVLLARILAAEAIPTIFLQVPLLQDEPVPCLRYEPLSGGFHGAPLLLYLWDLAHTFSVIRLRHGDGDEVMRLETYWPEKTPQDWLDELLRVTAEDSPRGVAKTFESPGGPGVFSRASVPESSFVHVVRLAGMALQKPGALLELIQRIPSEADRPSEEVAQKAAEILLRGGFITVEGVEIRPTERLKALDQAIRRAELDEASRLMEHL